MWVVICTSESCRDRTVQVCFLWTQPVVRNSNRTLRADSFYRGLTVVYTLTVTQNQNYYRSNLRLFLIVSFTEVLTTVWTSRLNSWLIRIVIEVVYHCLRRHCRHQYQISWAIFVRLILGWQEWDIRWYHITHASRWQTTQYSDSSLVLTLFSVYSSLVFTNFSGSIP